MIRWPWEKWKRPPPPMDVEEKLESEAALAEVERRKRATAQALQRRKAIVVHNHLANDIQRALGRRG